MFGIPISRDTIVSFKTKGYNSVNFDSRHLSIVFKTNKQASKADRALSYAEKFKPHFKNYRHQTSLTLREVSNRFSWLNQDVYDSEDSDTELDTDTETQFVADRDPTVQILKSPTSRIFRIKCRTTPIPESPLGIFKPSMVNLMLYAHT